MSKNWCNLARVSIIKRASILQNSSKSKKKKGLGTRSSCRALLGHFAQILTHPSNNKPDSDFRSGHCWRTSEGGKFPKWFKEQIKRWPCSNLSATAWWMPHPQFNSKLIQCDRGGKKKIIRVEKVSHRRKLAGGGGTACILWGPARMWTGRWADLTDRCVWSIWRCSQSLVIQSKQSNNCNGCL